MDEMQPPEVSHLDLMGDLKLDREFRLERAWRKGGKWGLERELEALQKEEQEQAALEASQPVTQA